ncbi:MAG: class I SAM-dependent methyltransferase [Pseudomonadota bacterium]
MAKIDLGGVPETMLWPLWNRAYEAKRKDRLIDDPLAIELVKTLDYDFRGSFGKPNRAHGVRARVGDDLVSDFLRRHNDRACVITLGEGLETQYWRLKEPEVPWLSVDLPEALGVRARLLPTAEAITPLALSAFDERWMDTAPDGLTPFISAMGLLMYFEEAEVVRLLTKIAERFPSAEVYFDAIPKYFSDKTKRGFNVTKNYEAPAMPWGTSPDGLSDFIEGIPGLEVIKVQTYAEPYPRAMPLHALLSKIGPIRRLLAPSLVHARVAG